MSRQSVSSVFMLICLGLAAVACGVRGRPQPPLTPAEIGRGHPTFKRATEEFAFPDVPAVGDTAVPATPTPTPVATPVATPSPTPGPSKSSRKKSSK